MFNKTGNANHTATEFAANILHCVSKKQFALLVFIITKSDVDQF